MSSRAFAQSYGQRISFYLSRYENIGVNSRTRCDIALAEAEFLNKTVMTLLSSGNVNISIHYQSMVIKFLIICLIIQETLTQVRVIIMSLHLVVDLFLGLLINHQFLMAHKIRLIQWYMGLGIEYPASQYGCQLAIPRNVGNPTLSVRFKEANNWGGWSAITAGVALSLNGTATFTVNVWHTSSDNQQRLYFDNNSYYLYSRTRHKSYCIS
jgi:hypothetical protein